MKKVAIVASTLALTSLVTVGSADAKTHTVKSGESLWSIAEKYNTTIEKIQKINKLDSELILPDQKLEVLVNGKYKVQKGDTLKELAEKFDVSVEQIKKLNKISSDKDLVVGKTIKIEKVNEQKKSAVAQTSHIVKPQTPVNVEEAPAVETKEVQSYEAPVQQEQAPVQAAPVQQAQAPVQQAQAPVQQTTYQAPAQVAPVQQAAPKAQTSSTAPASNSSVDAHLRVIMQRESGGNPNAVNPAGYYGLFQFSPQTWAAVGGSGNPANASVEEQWKRARILYTQYGAQHWSTAY